MLNNFSRYYNTNSYIHSLNPLCKILACLIFVFMTFLSNNFVVLFSLFIILIFLVCLSNVPYSFYFKSIYGMKILFLMIILINLLFGVSFVFSIIMVFKIVLIVLYSSCLIMTSTTNDIAYGFTCLLKPLSFFGFPVSKVSMAIALSLNFIPILFDTSNKIIKSQKSRGFNYNNGSLKDKILGIKTIFIPMFVLSIKKADSISDMMEVRCFSFNNNRSNIKYLGFSFNDFCMIFSHVVVFVFVLIKEVVV